MEQQNEHIAMLDLMFRPAFLVEKGLITHVNPPARQYLLRPGMPVASLLCHGLEEYEAFTLGQLYLQMHLGGQRIGATVMATQWGHVFLPEQAQTLPQLQAMALAASQLRMPLTGAMSATEQIFAQLTDPAMQEMAAQTNRRLLQLQRIVGNMSDALLYAQESEGSLEYTRVDTFLAQLLEKSAATLEKAGRTLICHLPCEPIYTLVDQQKLERAVLNMLSNALKASPAQSPIQFWLQQTGKIIRLSVVDQGQDWAQVGMAGVFSRFLREPALEDPHCGIGLGMVLMRSVAALHRGTILLDRPEDGYNRVTLTLAVQQSKQTMVRTPILTVDYAGERDSLLLELSDVLPSALYASQDL